MRNALLIMISLLLSAGLVFAQQTGETTQTEQMGQVPETVSFNAVQGYTVQNTDGTIQGSIVDAVIGQDGQIGYVVVSVSQPEQYAGKQYLVPPEVARMDTAGGISTLNVSEQELENLPVLSEANLEQGGSDWDAQAKSYWTETLGSGMQPSSIETPILLTSMLTTYKISTPEEESYGGVSDVIIDLPNAKVTELVYYNNETLGLSENRIGIESVTINKENENVMVEDTSLLEEPAILQEGGEETQTQTEESETE